MRTSPACLLWPASAHPVQGRQKHAATAYLAQQGMREGGAGCAGAGLWQRRPDHDVRQGSLLAGCLHVVRQRQHVRHTCSLPPCCRLHTPEACQEAGLQAQLLSVPWDRSGAACDCCRALGALPSRWAGQTCSRSSGRCSSAHALATACCSITVRFCSHSLGCSAAGAARKRRMKASSSIVLPTAASRSPGREGGPRWSGWCACAAQGLAPTPAAPRARQQRLQEGAPTSCTELPGQGPACSNTCRAAWGAAEQLRPACPPAVTGRVVRGRSTGPACPVVSERRAGRDRLRGETGAQAADKAGGHG